MGYLLWKNIYKPLEVQMLNIPPNINNDIFTLKILCFIGAILLQEIGLLDMSSFTLQLSVSKLEMLL